MSERQEIIRGIIADLEVMAGKGFQIPQAIQKAKKELNIGNELCARNAEDYKEKNKPFTPPCRSMGIGELGRQDLTFARSFRFLLSSKLVKPLENFIKFVKPNFIDKTLYFEVYEVIIKYDGIVFCEQVYDWVNSMYNEIDEELTLTTFDGCGVPLYEFKFYGLKTKQHDFSDFDYSVSDVLCQKILLSYDKLVRKSL